MIIYSIVICTFNQKDTLQDILESLRRQIKNPKLYEIVITDDGSTDCTNDFVRKLHFPIFLKYIRSESSIGRSENRNRGFQRTSGQWVIFLDGDMIPGPDFIKSYHDAWKEFPDSVCIGSWRFPEKWKNVPYMRYFSSRGRLTMNRGSLVPGKFFTSNNFAIRKDVFDKLGGFDITFKGWGGEDTDFGFKLENKSIPVVYVPQVVCEHYHWRTQGDVILDFFKFGQSGYGLLVNKHPDKVIFDKGWLLGLPGPNMSLMKRALSVALWPLRSSPVLTVLYYLAKIRQGALFTDTMFDWLFYGHLAKGYRNRKL